MATYLVRMKGRNFLINGADGPKKKQFRAIRLVEAANQERAENMARSLIQKDPRLKDAEMNDASDPPEISLESVSRISAAAYDAQNRANAFYWE